MLIKQELEHTEQLIGLYNFMFDVQTFRMTNEIYFCQGSTQLPPTNISKQCEHAPVIWFLSPSLQVPLPACKMKSFLCCGWQTAQSHWQFFVLLCHRALTSDRWSMAARRLGSKSETSLAVAREMRIDNRMMLNEGACQYIVRELTDLVKGEGRHGGWILAG